VRPRFTGASAAVCEQRLRGLHDCCALKPQRSTAGAQSGEPLHLTRLWTDIANGVPRAVWTGLCASVFADGNIHHGMVRVGTSLLLGQAQSVAALWPPDWRRPGEYFGILVLCAGIRYLRACMYAWGTIR